MAHAWLQRDEPCIRGKYTLCGHRGRATRIYGIYNCAITFFMIFQNYLNEAFNVISIRFNDPHMLQIKLYMYMPGCTLCHATRSLQ